MKISKINFVSLFVIFAFAFIWGTTLFLNQPVESLIGSESQVGWKLIVSKILLPIKFILIEPLLPFVNFLHQDQDPDTPPPFFVFGFAFYWITLALFLHYLLSKIRHYQNGN